jgi:hypothetical protein
MGDTPVNTRIGELKEAYSFGDSNRGRFPPYSRRRSIEDIVQILLCRAVHDHLLTHLKGRSSI